VVQRLDSYTDGFNKVGNLLTANQASVETDSSPFGAFLNCTISRSTAHSVHGSACLKAVATADGPFIAGLGESFPVVPGETITATFALKADREIVGVRVTIQWATGGSPGAVVYRTVTATTSWVTHSLTVVVPSGVETAGLFSWVTIHAAAGSEIYMDCFGVWKGAGGQWAMPGTPIVGQSSIAINNAVHLSGTGSPESVISAAPGSTYLQTDSVVDVKGWIRWIKATGTGNTGWQVGPEADTGWRRIVAWAGDAYTEGAFIAPGADWNISGAGAGYLLLRRQGARLSLVVYGSLALVSSPTGVTPASRLCALPTGFGVGSAQTTSIKMSGDTVIALEWGGSEISRGGNTTYPSGGWWLTGGASLSALTDTAWPTSLPGVAP
jgi:hypothetical protein